MTTIDINLASVLGFIISGLLTVVGFFLVRELKRINGSLQTLSDKLNSFDVNFNVEKEKLTHLTDQCEDCRDTVNDKLNIHDKRIGKLEVSVASHKK